MGPRAQIRGHSTSGPVCIVVRTLQELRRRTFFAMPPRAYFLSTLAACSLLSCGSTGCSMINAYPEVDRDEQATTKGEGEEPAATPWTRGFGGVGDDAASAVAIGPDDSIVLAGSFSDTIDFGLGPLHSYGGTDAFLLGLCLLYTSPSPRD